MRRFALLWCAGLAALCGCGSQVDGATSGGQPGDTTSSGSTSSGAGGSGGGATGSTEPDPKFLPKASGTCRTFADGSASFAPKGIMARKVLLSAGASGKKGPLVFFWHGAGGDPKEAPYALSQAAISAIKAAGGVVAAPYHDPAAGQLPWFQTTGTGPDDDLLVADEVVACAIAIQGIDTRRIYSLGFSAGALNTTQMSYRRSGYLASVVTFSGGKLGNPPDQDPNNKLPAMIFHGGASDQVLVNFRDLSQAWREDLKVRGHFAFICDHGKGHTVPNDAPPSTWQFLSDHPFGVAPEPYATALPASFPKYCAL